MGRPPEPADLTEKFCLGCKKVLPIERFPLVRKSYGDRGHKRNGRCRACTNAGYRQKRQRAIARWGIDKVRERTRLSVRKHRISRGMAVGYRRPVKSHKQMQKAVVATLVFAHWAEYRRLMEAEKEQAIANGFTIRKPAPNHIDLWDES